MIRSISLAVGAIAVAVLLLTGLGAWYFTSLSTTGSGDPEPITVAYSPFEATALFWIAEDSGFFKDNGLNVTIRRYDSGAAALDGMANGDADIAVGTSEFPFVTKAFQNRQIRIMANIDKGDFIYIVGRKDRGIENVSDLKGKTIGTTRGTVAQFHLGRFLNLYGMSMQDITLVEVKTPEEWVNAVVNGDIDAVATAQPYANSAKDRLGTNAVFWQAQSNQPVNSLVISTDDWIAEHPELAGRFIKSLTRAEDYAHTHPDEARAIVQKRLNLSDAYIDTVWKQNRFSVSLDKSLIITMEDEGRWMIANNLTSAKTVPDYSAYIYTKGLREIKPEAVNIR